MEILEKGGVCLLPSLRPPSPGFHQPPILLFCRQGGAVGRLEGVVVLQCWENKGGTSSSVREPARGGPRLAREPSPGDIRGEALQRVDDFFPSELPSWLVPTFTHQPLSVKTQVKSITIY